MPLTPTPQQIVEIRHLHDQGTLNVRAWAEQLDCGTETIRRIARRETYRSIKSGQDAAPRERGQAYHPTSAPMVGEPTEEEIAASLARMQAVFTSTPTAAEADSLLNELTQKGRDAR
jgi:hypothetical protein